MNAYKRIIPIFFLVLMPNCGGSEKPVEQEQQPVKECKMPDNKNVIALDSGLRYEILCDSTGAQAQKGLTAEVHYTGWLNDGDDGQGNKFDSSLDRGQTFSFPLGAGYVIKGWDEGVALMKVGQKIRLYIPSGLGYGARGAGAVIPPNADLIFDVELIALH